jgi:hypothetical protein
VVLRDVLLKFRRNKNTVRFRNGILFRAFFIHSFIHCERLIVYGIPNFRIALGICCWITALRAIMIKCSLIQCSAGRRDVSKCQAIGETAEWNTTHKWRDYALRVFMQDRHRRNKHRTSVPAAFVVTSLI